MLDVVDLGGHGAAVGLTVATVTVLRNRLKLAGAILVLVTFIVASVLSIIVDLYLHANTGTPLHWTRIPLVAVISWLSAMGAWSGGKTVFEQFRKKEE